MHAHPTQSLLDLMTVRENKGEISGLRIAIIGDITHSRVARSNSIGFKKMGADVVLAGPRTMIPKGIEDLDVLVTYDVEEAIRDADVIMMLRIQKERQQRFLFPTEREYSTVYGLTKAKLRKAKENVLIMHPGPINRGVEIAYDVADGPYSIILGQVTNGVAVRMALLYLVAGGARDADAD
jgi:aspartate carbamoyltransferase catalytic subunit